MAPRVHSLPKANRAALEPRSGTQPGGKKEKRAHVPLGKLIADAVASGTFFYSFEFSAARDPRPEDLYARVQRMTERHRPLWVDLTWGFGAVGARTIEAARHIQKHTGVPVLMHLICTDMTVAVRVGARRRCRRLGV